MNALTGTGAYVRLALRRDRVRLPVWFGSIAVLVIGVLRLMVETYPTAEARQGLTRLANINPAELFMLGPVADASAAGVASWRIESSAMIFLGLASVLAVLRHTRGQEEDGGRELLGAAVLGRSAPLAGALLVVLAANVAVAGMVVSAAAGLGFPLVGTLVLGLQLVADGMVMAAVAALAAQWFGGTRSALAGSMTVFGVWFVLRGIGDAGVATWASWVSPLAWIRAARPYAENGLAVLLAVAALTVAVILLAVVALWRRDLGGALLPPWPGRQRASKLLARPYGLVWRLHRGTVWGWTAGMLGLGLLAGGVVEAATEQVQGSDALSGLAAGPDPQLAFLGFLIYLVTQFVALVGIQVVLGLRRQETAGGAEMVLATAVSRTRWSLAHAGVAASSLVLTLAALGLGLGIGLGDERASLLAASLVRWPALAIFSAVAVLVYGLLPRWTLPVSYLALVGAVLVDLLVEFRITGDWVATASPFAVTPALPLENFSPSPVVIMVAIAALATAAGLVAFSLRDLRG